LNEKTAAELFVANKELVFKTRKKSDSRVNQPIKNLLFKTKKKENEHQSCQQRDAEKSDRLKSAF
jgi:hypothetical protein